MNLPGPQRKNLRGSRQKKSKTILTQSDELRER